MVNWEVGGCINQADKNSNILTLVTILIMYYNYITAYYEPWHI